LSHSSPFKSNNFFDHAYDNNKNVIHINNYNNNCIKNNNDINVDNNNNLISNINNLSSNNNINKYSFNTRVLNISCFSFDPIVYSLLEKGLNFSLALRKMSIYEIIYDIEFWIRDLPDNTKDIIRQDYAIILRK